MSSRNHPTSHIEDAFSSNFLDFIPASPDYVLTSLGKTYSSSSNSFGIVSITSPSLSLFHNDPYMKVLQAFYAKESPIPPPNPITPPVILTPSLTPTLPQIYKLGKSSIKMRVKHYEEQVESILNYLEELSFHRIEKMEERLVNGWIIIPRDFDEVKTKLKEARTQIFELQKKYDTVYEERENRVEKVSTTTASLDAEQDIGIINRAQSTKIPNEPIPQGTGLGGSPMRQDTILGDRPAQTRFERLSKQSYEPPLSGVNTLRSGEDNMQLMKLMELCTKLSARVLALENNKTAQDLEITYLKKRDAEIQGRYGHDVEINTASTPITTVSINITTAEPVTTISTPIITAGVSVSNAEPSTPLPTTTTVIEDKYLTIAQTLMKMRSEKSKEKAKERGSKEKSSETATRPTKGLIIREASETTTRPTVPPQQKLYLKDKGNGKMVEPEKPLKKKDQIEFDKEVSQILQAQLQAELEKGERMARQKEKDANIAKRDDVQAMIDAEHELAE
nr:hypothetical protein [Tanacetum cinerariifolium]